MLQGAIGEFRSQVRFAGAAYDEPIFTVAYQFPWFCLFKSCEVDRQAGTLALLEGVERGELSPLHPVRAGAAARGRGPRGIIGRVQDVRAGIRRSRPLCRYSQVLVIERRSVTKH